MYQRTTTKALWTLNEHIYKFTIYSFFQNLNSHAGEIAKFRTVSELYSVSEQEEGMGKFGAETKT